MLRPIGSDGVVRDPAAPASSDIVPRDRVVWDFLGDDLRSVFPEVVPNACLKPRKEAHLDRTGRARDVDHEPGFQEAILRELAPLLAEEYEHSGIFPSARGAASQQDQRPPKSLKKPTSNLTETCHPHTHKSPGARAARRRTPVVPNNQQTTKQTTKQQPTNNQPATYKQLTSNQPATNQQPTSQPRNP